MTLNVRSIVLVAGLGLIATYAALLSTVARAGTWETYAALIVAPLLLLLSVPLARRLSAATGDPVLGKLLLWGAVAKLVGAVLRYVVVYGLYESGDAIAYADAGTVLAGQLRDGYLSLPPGRSLIGTQFIEVVTGVLFAVVGRSNLVGFLVFSALGFVGAYCFIRAFDLGVPRGDTRRFAALVLFMPSLVFWPSSIGKDSWMLLGLGLCAYGVARLVTHHAFGFTLVTLGLLATCVVRPHVSLLVCAGLLIALLLRRPPARLQLLGPMARLLSVGALVLGTAATLSQAEAYFGVEEEGLQGFGIVLDEATRRTSQGGSEFLAPQGRSLATLPSAFVTVMFRPFPHEATNLLALVASLEGAALAALFAVSWRRLRRLPGWLPQAFVAFAVAYSLLFVLAFSSVGNFGIITRQRVQLFPLVFTVLALPAAAADNVRKPSAAPRDRPRTSSHA